MLTQRHNIRPGLHEASISASIHWMSAEFYPTRPDPRQVSSEINCIWSSALEVIKRKKSELEAVSMKLARISFRIVETIPFLNFAPVRSLLNGVCRSCLMPIIPFDFETTNIRGSKFIRSLDIECCLQYLKLYHLRCCTLPDAWAYTIF